MVGIDAMIIFLVIIFIAMLGSALMTMEEEMHGLALSFAAVAFLSVVAIIVERQESVKLATAVAYCVVEVQGQQNWAELSNADLLALVRQVQPAIGGINIEALHEQCFEQLQTLSVSTEG